MHRARLGLDCRFLLGECMIRSEHRLEVAGAFPCGGGRAAPRRQSIFGRLQARQTCLVGNPCSAFPWCAPNMFSACHNRAPLRSVSRLLRTHVTLCRLADRTASAAATVAQTNWALASGRRRQRGSCEQSWVGVWTRASARLLRAILGVGGLLQVKSLAGGGGYQP